MTKSGKVKAAVAGVATVAMVAAGAISGGSPAATSGQTSFSDSVLDLQRTVEYLIERAERQGIELPEGAGIRDIVEGLDGLIPTHGSSTYATVSSSGGVRKGDPVRYALEPDGTVTDPRYIVGNDRTILAMASGAADWTNSQWSNKEQKTPQNTNSAFVCVSGNTFLHVRTKENYSASTTVCAGAATSADVYCTFDGHILVAYAEGGAGVLQVYKADKQGYGIILSDALTYVWAATGGPDNIRLTYDSVDDRISILCTVADETGARYGAVYDLAMSWHLDDVLSDVEIKLTADACPALRGLSPDAEAKGWDIFSGYYHEVLVTCPTATGRQAIIWTDRDESGATAVKGYVLSKVKGGTDAVLDWVPCEGGPETMMLAQTVRENGTSRVYLELLWRRASDGKPHIASWGHVPGSDSNREIAQLRICNDLYMSPYTSPPGASLVSWVTDGGLYAATVERPFGGSARISPAVRVTDTDRVGAILERGGSTAKVVYATDALREGYVSFRRKVSSCEARSADGYVTRDAAAGTTCYFVRTRRD